MLGEALSEQSLTLHAVRWITERNVLVGNMLERWPDGRPSGRSEIPIMHYEWCPADLNVVIHETNMGSIINEAQVDSTGVMSLFGPPEPTLLWKGKAFRLHEAAKDLVEPTAKRGNN